MALRLQVGENRVGITLESLVLFLAFTAVGTVGGMILWQWVQPYLPKSMQTPQSVQDEIT